MAANYDTAPILTVEGLKQYFKVSKTYTVKAVDDVSFRIYPGETYGLVANPVPGNPPSAAASSGFTILPAAGSALTEAISAERFPRGTAACSAPRCR